MNSRYVRVNEREKKHERKRDQHMFQIRNYLFVFVLVQLETEVLSLFDAEEAAHFREELIENLRVLLYRTRHTLSIY